MTPVESRDKDQTNQQTQRTRSSINIESIKALVIEKFPRNSALAAIIVEERDSLKIDEFLAKMEIWLKLLRRIKD
jgi:hypothetical protein